MDWSLVLNNPESLNCYSISGRAREMCSETPEKYQEGTTSCCLSGFLVNLTFVKTVEKLDVELTSGETVYVSKPKRKEFMEALAGYWGKML